MRLKTAETGEQQHFIGSELDLPVGFWRGRVRGFDDVIIERQSKRIVFIAKGDGTDLFMSFEDASANRVNVGRVHPVVVLE